MINIVIDTNIYRSDPGRKKASFKALERIILSGKIKLHIPYFVKYEFITQQIEEYNKDTASVQDALTKLRRKSFSPDLEHEISTIEQSFTNIKERITVYAEQEFTLWIQSIEAEVHSISDSHGLRVAEAYFEGKPPFKSQKTDNLEDALIGHEVFSYDIPDDNNEGKIWGIYELEHFEISTASIQYYGDGDFAIPFSALLDASLTFSIFKGDFYVLDEGEIERISISELNDHYFEAEETFPISVQGFAILHLELDEEDEANFSEQKIVDLIENADVTIESIDSIKVVSETYQQRLES